jgi:hypothetical protein
MKKMLIKNKENKIKMPDNAIYVNGFLIKASICNSKLNMILYNKDKNNVDNVYKEKK